jgi:hypothetical protein
LIQPVQISLIKHENPCDLIGGFSRDFENKKQAADY